MERPAALFDREWEWDQLTRFAGDARPGTTLGIVSGRRRQGKSVLLQALCEASGGFYHEAIEDVPAGALRRLGADLGRHLGAPGPIGPLDWSAALDALMEVGAGDAPKLVVLDEFPYLVRSSPELPSLLQREIGPGKLARTRLL